MVKPRMLNDRLPIVELERDFGVSTETIAHTLGVDRQTVERWRSNQSEPQGRTRERLGELVALRAQLRGMFETKEIMHEWLRTPSLYLGWLTSLEVLKAGRLDRVRADLDELATGVYL